jgi:hypothetical protein
VKFQATAALMVAPARFAQWARLTKTPRFSSRQASVGFVVRLKPEFLIPAGVVRMFGVD